MISELVLYYGLDTVQQQLLKAVLDNLSMDCREIKMNQQDFTIARLVEGDELLFEDKETPVVEFAESVAILNDLSDDRINEFLAAVRNTAGLKIDLKAVVTEHNADWKFSELLGELRQENMVMQTYMSVRSQVRTIRQWLADKNLVQNPLTSVQQWLGEIDEAAGQAEDILAVCDGGQEIDIDLLQKISGVLSNLINRTFESED